MTRISVAAISLGLVCLLCNPAFADRINYQMVTVGNPGNASDTGGSGIGAVAYSYQIGKYDVTIGQYAAFLNAVAATDTYSLYNTRIATNLNVAGISRVGFSGSYTYSVIGSANRPITAVTWFDAARFANWMTNGQGSGSTETGAYTLNGTTSGNAVAANPGAAFRLPTENEWYKAAYYSPNYVSPYDEPNLGGPRGPGVPGYYAFATQSDMAPGNQIGSATNQANYITGAGYSVTQSSSYDANENYLTDVGAFTTSASYYGTFDQSGNVFEWNDLDGAAGSSRGMRGGSWYNDSPLVLSSAFNDPDNAPTDYGYGTGFRLATSAVPEIDPNSLGSVLALVLGSLGLLERRRLKAS